MTDDLVLSRRRLMGLGAGLLSAAAIQTVPLARPAAAETAESSGDTYEMPVDVGALLPRERLGIQLYTVRNLIQTFGFATVLTRLRAMGYTQIEFAGFTGGGVSSLAELKMIVDDLGLQPAGAHVNVNAMAAQIEACQVLGIPALGQASLPTFSSGAQARQAGENWNRLGQQAKDAGLRFYLHNHANEFGTFSDDGVTKRHYDAMLQYTDPDLVFFELDIYWAFQGRAQNGNSFQPVDYVVNNPDRFILFHVKDGNPLANQLPVNVPFVSSNSYTMTDVGQGSIDFESFFNAIRRKDLEVAGDGSGARRGYMLEHDNPGNGKGEWRTAATGYGWMAHGLRVV
jgi:sugar phosphate isomerase/epimerase